MQRCHRVSPLTGAVALLTVGCSSKIVSMRSFSIKLFNSSRTVTPSLWPEFIGETSRTVVPVTPLSWFPSTKQNEQNEFNKSHFIPNAATHIGSTKLSHVHVNLRTLMRRTLAHIHLDTLDTSHSRSLSLRLGVSPLPIPGVYCRGCQQTVNKKKSAYRRRTSSLYSKA